MKLMLWLFTLALALSTSGLARSDASSVGCFGMACCPSGLAATGISSDSLECRQLPSTESSQDCFVDHATIRSGMHACPQGTYVRGVEPKRNLLTCCYDQRRGYSALAAEELSSEPRCSGADAVLTGIDAKGSGALCRVVVATDPGTGSSLPGFSIEGSRSFLAWRGKVSHDAWKRVVRNWLLRILDVEPGLSGTAPAAPHAEVLSGETLLSGVSRMKIRYTASVDGSDVYSYLLLPPRFDPGQLHPAVLFTHGHDQAGKEGSAVDASNIHHAGALALAEQGYVALAPDTRGFGERRMRGVDHDELTNLLMQGTGHHGVYPQLYMHDDLQAVSFLLAQPGVDATRVYSTGLSLGGWQAAWIGAIDERLAGTIAGGIYFGMSCLNQSEIAHACQTVPALSSNLDKSHEDLLFDTDDLGALIAPRPLLAMWGDEDEFWKDAPWKSCTQDTTRRTREIYQAIGAPELFEVSVRRGMPHEFDNPAAIAFLKRIASASFTTR